MTGVVFTTLLSVLAFRLALDVSYVHIISEYYAGYGLVLNSDVVKLLESYVALLVLFVLMPQDDRKFSSLALQMFFLIAYVPLLSFYGLSNGSREWFYLATIFWFTVIAVVRGSLTSEIVAVREMRRLVVLIPLILVPAAFIFLFASVGTNVNFDFNKVYEFRAMHKATGPSAAGYVINWVAGILVPFLVVAAIYGGRKKHYLLFGLALFLGTWMFASTGSKEYLFRLPAIIGIAWLIGRSNFFAKTATIFAGLVVAGLLSFTFFDDLWVTNLISRRVFLGPAQISFYYYDFFDARPLMLAATRLAKPFIDYPYELSPGHLIGLNYFRAPEMNANNGIVADGFMNFGHLGVLLWGVIFALLLKWAEMLCRGKNRYVAFPVLLLSLFALVNGFLLTSLLTHGILLAFLLVYCMPRDASVRSETSEAT